MYCLQQNRTKFPAVTDPLGEAQLTVDFLDNTFQPGHGQGTCIDCHQFSEWCTPGKKKQLWQNKHPYQGEFLQARINVLIVTRGYDSVSTGKDGRGVGAVLVH